MAIVFQCTCGRPLRANLEAVGKRTKCPGCGQILTIPSALDKPPASPTVASSSQENSAITDAGDPFAPELDWSTPESRDATLPDPKRSGSGIIAIDSAHAETASAEATRPDDGSRQYCILSQKEQGFSGKFNPAKYEEMLNSHARQGWCLKAAVTMNLPSHGGHHDELILILER